MENSQYYNYGCRGNNCVTISNALTSNGKYIMPLNPVYYQPWTDMYRYPGYSEFIYPNVYTDGYGPETLKAWKAPPINSPYDYYPRFHHSHGGLHRGLNELEPREKRKSCPGCTSHGLTHAGR